MDWKERFSSVELIYRNALAGASDIQNFRLEGKAAVSFPMNRLRLENALDPALGQQANFVFWCPVQLPENIAVTWEFWPLREPGLSMLFFAASGTHGEDLFDARLPARSGVYDQYRYGGINAYHISYFRRKEADERSFHTCNLRKSSGFHLAAQGADPIPSALEAKGPYRMRLLKYKGEISFAVNELTLFCWIDDGQLGGPALTEGKIGFRQLAPLVAEYADLQVFQLR